MNTLLENLLTVFLKITLLSWLIWGLIGLVIVIVIIYIYISDKIRLNKILPYMLPVIVIPFMIKNLLSHSELVEYIPILEELGNINDILFIIMGILIGIAGWNMFKEL